LIEVRSASFFHHLSSIGELTAGWIRTGRVEWNPGSSGFLFKREREREENRLQYPLIKITHHSYILDLGCRFYCFFKCFFVIFSHNLQLHPFFYVIISILSFHQIISHSC
jgi:hypothetical protein